jgi:hypothetical protein
MIAFPLFLGHWINAAIPFIFLLIFSWFIEFDADFYAIKNIGIDEFERLTVQSGTKPKWTIKRVIFYIWMCSSHPPKSVVAKVYRLLHTKADSTSQNNP